MTATQTERVRLVLDKLDGVKGGHGKWTALCPAHDDHERSLSIGVDDGRVLLNCFADCDYDAILDSIGLSRDDINPNPILAIYDYRDETGLLYQVVRKEPKKFLQRRPNGGDWIWSLGNVRRVLYRLPELIASDPAEPVWITEGEKDSDRLAALGFTATTNAAGAKNWRAEYNEPLRGRSVVILEDNDPPGRERVRLIGRALDGIAADIRVVLFRDLPEHADVSDWLDAGGVAGELASLAIPFSDWTAGDDQSGPETESEIVWPARQPLPAATPAVPALPPAMIPEPLRRWLTDLSERAALPLELFAAPAIGALGAVVGRQVGIRPSRYDDWTCIPNLWGGIVAPSGSMKSYVLAQATAPVRRLAATAHERYAGEIDAADAKQARIEAEIRALKKRMEEASKKGQPLESLEAEYAAKQAETRDAATNERRYLTQDATTEKLGELLRDNPRGLLLLRDELAGWLRTLDRSGREGDREFYLESWNGTGSYTQDRIGRGSVHIPALTLSIMGGIQPGKLAGYIADATGDGAGADGLLQRLQLLIWPDSLGDWQAANRWGDTTAKTRAYAIYEYLDTLDVAKIGATGDACGVPYLTFDPDAQRLFDQWRDQLEQRLRSGAMDATPAFASHVSKWRSLMPSLALLFHLVTLADGSPSAPVSEPAARLAAAWCDYLEQHARKLYATEINPGTGAANRLAALITSGRVIDGQNVRDVYRPHWGGLATPDLVYAALATLANAGWVRVETVRTGGRPQQVIRLHPGLMGCAE